MSQKMWRGRWSSKLRKEDAKFLTKIPVDNRQNFYEYVIDTFSTLSRIDYKTKSEKYGMEENELRRAGRFYLTLLTKLHVMNDTEIISALEEIGINADDAKEILDYAKKHDEKINIIREHLSTDLNIKLEDIDWSINVKYASSQYIKKPEVFANILIETSKENESITIELSKDDLSWLEEIIIDIKEKFLEVQKILEESTT